MSVNFLKAPCGCFIDCPLKIILLWEQSEKHKKLHEEYDAGIEHDWKCKTVMIPVPQLEFNEKLLKSND